MRLKDIPTVLHANASGAAVGLVIHDHVYRDTGYLDKVSLQAVGTFTALSAQPQISLDGTNWEDVGTAWDGATILEVTVRTPWFRCPIVSLGSGSVTILAA